MTQQGRRSRPGHVPTCTPATCRKGRSSIRRIGSVVSKEARRRGRGPAQLRQHRAVPLLQPGGLRVRLPRAAVRAARSSARVDRDDPAQLPRTLRAALQVPGPAPPPSAGEGARRRPASICCKRLQKDFLAAPAGRAGAEPPDRLRPGRAADADGRRQGVQPGRRASAVSRRLRPQPVRPGLPAGPPAGRARRAVRRGDARRLNGGGSAGTRTRTTSIRSRS